MTITEDELQHQGRTLGYPRSCRGLNSWRTLLAEGPGTEICMLDLKIRKRKKYQKHAFSKCS